MRRRSSAPKSSGARSARASARASAATAAIFRAFAVTEPARVREARPQLVEEAAALREADRARVLAMMQYGERLARRWAQVRAHFGETRAVECGRCDVCAPAHAPDGGISIDASEGHP